jgi:hypothetical protein
VCIWRPSPDTFSKTQILPGPTLGIGEEITEAGNKVFPQPDIGFEKHGEALCG